MAKIKWNAGTLLSPLPAALISCGTIENPNVMTAAWVGIINSDPPRAYVSIRPERLSHSIINEGMDFVINVTTEKLKFAADYCGVKSGRDVDKFKACSINAVKSFAVVSPSIEESPISLECKVFEIMKLGSHDMFLADIVAVSVEDALIDSENRLQLENANVISYTHGEYYSSGEYIGHFGWSVKKDGNIKKR
ncbi:MAG: flavin reductase family protein [Oscillospiraceae bacterium]|nr:flavin reductase family protein [Oscillospiraceae bacterium]